MRTKTVLRTSAFVAVCLVIVLVLSSSNITSFASGPQQGQAVPQLVESGSTVVTKVGNWTSQSTESASGGSYLYSSGSADDALTFDFKGSSVEISYVASPHLGQLAIEIDNSVRRTVVTTSNSTQFNQRAIINYLDDGIHTLRVFPVAGVIAIDAFYTVLPPGGHVDVPNGYMIIEEDIIVPVDFYDTYGENAHPSEAYASNLWPSGNVPYEFDANVDATNQGRARTAMDGWEAVAPVTFTQCASNNCTQTYHVHIQSGSGNSSHVGYGNANHTVNIYNWTYNTIIMHELGHTLGFWHEQSRPDRDTYVTIVWDKIISSYSYNFNIATGAGYYGAYDFDSMMHYGECAFSVGGNPCAAADRTIVVKAPYQDQQGNIGQRDHTSALDGEEMRHIYAGSISSTPSFSSPSVSSEDTTPTFTWNSVTNGTLYYLWVGKVGGATYIDKKYTTVETGCNGGGSCSVTPTFTWDYGCYNAYIQAQNAHNSSAWSGAYNFCINAPVLPGAATLTSPSGSTSENPSTFVWQAGSNATYYRLYVSGPSGVIHDAWYSATTAGCAGGGTCSVSPGIFEQAGTHNWWVLTWNASGYGPWAGPLVYTQTNPPSAPGVITPIAPNGTTDDRTPTYQWNADEWASWYYLWVGTGGSQVYASWYSASQAGCPSGTGTCSVTPTTELANSSYTWYMRAWGNLGYGPWNSGMNFTISFLPPSAPVLNSPSGVITSSLPTFSWNPSTGNPTQYRFYMSTPSGVVEQYFTPAALGCSGGIGTCSTKLNTYLPDLGVYYWWVAAQNAYGWGNWSSSLSFTYAPPIPSAVTLVSPNSTITDNTPTFTWNASSVATWYYLYVYNTVTGEVYTGWYHISAAGCPLGTGTCSVTPSTVLKNNTHQWWIYAYNSAGATWSNYLQFTVNAAQGFNSQFNGSASGWYITGNIGDSWYYNNYYLYTSPGVNGNWNSVYYNQTFTDFDYSTILWRTGCTTCSTSIWVRGDPLNTQVQNGWNTGYLFNYTTSGDFSVWRLDGASATALQGWSYSPTIYTGSTWNTLRVIGIGNTMYYYINGGLVWVGSDSTYTSGYVGLGYYQDSGGQIWSDWAVLQTITADPVVNDTVSAEQQALNNAANRQESSFGPNQSGPSYAADSRTENAAAPPVVNPGVAHRLD